MWIRRLTHSRHGFEHPSPSEITPRAVYEGRRAWLKQWALGLGGASLSAWALPGVGASSSGSSLAPGKLTPLPAEPSTTASGAVVLEPPTRYEDATSYNNFYEFGTDKADPARYAQALKVQPWTVMIEGAVKKPGPVSLEELHRLAPMEDRIYRLRCVEGWSMVIPWVGYALNVVLRRAEPTGNAKFVEFVTLADPQQMPGVRSRTLDWPYVEGLRLDEAMHPLTMLAFGMYGEVLPKQNGAPVRLVVPWKYGFKSAKSLVKIRLVEHQPKTAWVKAAAHEYGFYANVNPNVEHPRWSQAMERRIGEGGLFAKKRPTLMLNGYEAQVGALYAGLDWRKHY